LHHRLRQQRIDKTQDAVDAGLQAQQQDRCHRDGTVFDSKRQPAMQREQRDAHSQSIKQQEEYPSLVDGQDRAFVQIEQIERPDMVQLSILPAHQQGAEGHQQ